jgi:hypothetical protein
MRLAKTLIILALGGFSAVAAAGMKTNVATVIGSGYMSGGLSSARYSSNTLEYLSCDQYSTGYINCSARSATGATAYCYTDASTNPSFAETMRAMNSASLVYVWFDPATSACTSILVRNGSNYLP